VTHEYNNEKLYLNHRSGLRSWLDRTELHKERSDNGIPRQTTVLPSSKVINDEQHDTWAYRDGCLDLNKDFIRWSRSSSLFLMQSSPTCFSRCSRNYSFLNISITKSCLATDPKNNRKKHSGSLSQKIHQSSVNLFFHSAAHFASEPILKMENFLYFGNVFTREV
jgi:hypothetical protein